MKKQLLATLLGLLVILAGGFGVQAETTELDTVVAALQAPFRGPATAKRIRDLQADFTQEAYLSALDQVQTASGRIVVRFDDTAAGAPFRWEYLQPDPQLIVSDGQTVWVYMPENRQVLESPLPEAERAQADNPLAFLTDLGHLDRQFLIRWGEPSRTPAGDFRLLLQPRQPSAYLEQLLLEVDRSVVAGATGFPLKAATLFGSADNRTTVRFGGARVNQGTAPDQFCFTPPPGTEVLRPGAAAFGQ